MKFLVKKLDKHISLIGCGSRLSILSENLTLNKISHSKYQYEPPNDNFEQNTFEKIKQSNKNNQIFFCNYPKKLKCDWNLFQSFILHGGPVPQYRGASVINWQILNGEPNIGLSILKFSGSFDQGEIIETATINIEGMHTLDEVRHEIDGKFSDLCLKIVNCNMDNIKGKKQHGSVRYWHKRSKVHMEFNPNHHTFEYLRRLFKSSEQHYRPYIVLENSEIELLKVGDTIIPEICGHVGHILKLEGRNYLILKEGAIEIEI